jgi:hypothetical protein
MGQKNEEWRDPAEEDASGKPPIACFEDSKLSPRRAPSKTRTPDITSKNDPELDYRIAMTQAVARHIERTAQEAERFAAEILHIAATRTLRVTGSYAPPKKDPA